MTPKTNRPPRAKKVTYGRAQAVKKVSKKSEIKQFVKSFYSRYGEMMSQLSHE